MGLLFSQTGQALVEYLLLVAFLIIISSKLALGFNNFMRDSIGNLGHVVSLNLTVGVCQSDCFFESYVNGTD
ncbi:MAG: hypothetical protein QF441_12130 [Bacteriovoracaceae bacterium]|jgi:hypothetical protein|nr:hypothetical protein [Halobacteriovoraceae bacterium]MDP7321353.1 hypothetical protein [Bacteriovoracaceae bacterium]|tara:strand:+ start:188 stop:403 length:216 start_codon:yes stop_codon:yes gene_type:complete